MSDYKQTRDAAGNVTSQYGQMLTNLGDKEEYSCRPTLPYDYARCMTQGCPLEKTCMRKTPGRETYQTCFGPDPSDTCKYYISEEEWK